MCATIYMNLKTPYEVKQTWKNGRDDATHLGHPDSERGECGVWWVINGYSLMGMMSMSWVEMVVMATYGMPLCCPLMHS